MKVHIVQVNETLRDIARKYNITVEDIIKNNQHISHARHILPGMKLKLPILSEEANTRFRDQMLQIHDYYPTLEDFHKAADENKSPEEGVKQAPSATQTVSASDTPSQRPQTYMYMGQAVVQPSYPYAYLPGYTYPSYPTGESWGAWPHYNQTYPSFYHYFLPSGTIPYVHPTYPSQPIPLPSTSFLQSQSPRPPYSEMSERKEPSKRGLKIDLRQRQGTTK